MTPSELKRVMDAVAVLSADEIEHPELSGMASGS